MQHGIAENLVSYSVDYIGFVFFITDSTPCQEACNSKENILYFILYALFCRMLNDLILSRIMFFMDVLGF
jgi:hypothetical protein